RAYPNARARPGPLDLSGESRHVGELLVAPVPGADACLVRTAVGLPAVVDHGERPVGVGRGELHDMPRVGEHGRRAVVAVDPVPVVAAVDRLRGKPGTGTHL